MNEEEQRIYDATFGAAYVQTYNAMRDEPNTRYPALYALHRAQHIALCAVEDLRTHLAASQPSQGSKE